MRGLRVVEACVWFHRAVLGSIADVNDHRCVGGFVCARVRCLGVVRSQSLTKCKKCEVNTKGSEVVAAVWYQ